MLNTSLSPWPSFTQEEADAVSKVLLSNKVNYWTGTECREFEKEFAAFVGTQYAVALSNGTLALDVALKAMGIGQGDDVIVTSRTFLASASCIVTAGANPVFADVDLNSQNISAETIKAALTPNTKAIIVVHLAGMPAEMDDIMALAKEHNLWVIEDCAQAHGAKYKGKSVGSIGHVGAWSFCQDKIMTTGGEGGMVRWLHESFGTNWRMMEMQAVIGRIQLKRMPEWTARRQENAAKLAESLGKFASIRLVEVADYIEHAQYKFYVFVKPEHLKDGWTRDRIVSELNARKVPCYQGSCSEVYLEKAFDNTPWRPKERLKNAVQLGNTSLMFLVHPTLNDEEIAFCKENIEAVLTEATA